MPRVNKELTVIMIAIVLITFSVTTAFGSVLDSTLGTQFSGSAITGTQFANISSTEPNGAMFPGSEIYSTDDSVSMEISYSVTANLTDAVDSAISFMNQFDYIRLLNLTFDENWSRLNLNSLRWSLRFQSSSAEVYVGVNAITGSVVEYHIKWIGPSPYVRTIDSNTLSVEAIEIMALRFFEQNNLTLSTHSYYVPATLEYEIMYLTHYVYALHFFEVINDTLIEGNSVSLYLDIQTGTVVSFGYQWTYVNEIPTIGIIEKNLGDAYAIEYINQESSDTDYRITRSVLVFKNFGTSESIVYTLCWAVYTDNSEIAVVYVNAKSGDIISIMEYAAVSPFIDDTRLDLISLILPFTLSIPLGLLAYIIVKHSMKINTTVSKILYKP